MSQVASEMLQQIQTVLHMTTIKHKVYVNSTVKVKVYLGKSSQESDL